MDSKAMEAKLTSKGQVTIPKEIRDTLGLRAGNRLDFVLEEDGVLRLIPLKGSIKELKGILPSPERPVTLEEMEEAIRKRARRE
jgi:AbrB family looped-hinge helix DNA binding protein